MASHQNHQQKKYRLLRAVTLWLHNGKCFACKEEFEKMECHHINKNSLDHRIENFMPLCKKHHNLIGKSNVAKEFEIPFIIELLQAKIDYYKSKL